MSSKWQTFHSKHSPVVAGTVDQGANNVVLDWFRTANAPAHQELTTINGIPVKNYLNQYNQFATIDDVKNFFKEVILKDVKNETDKNKMVDYLVKSLHQGGLLYPVSASMSVMLHKDHGLQPRSSESIKQVNITTTEQGFKVQEVYTSKGFIMSDPGKASNQVKELAEQDDMFLLYPDPGKKFVIQASASVDVNFSANPDNPAITVESNYVSYGNSAIQSSLDKRSLGQIIVDFLRNIFGLNSVSIKEMEAPKQSQNTELTTDNSIELTTFESDEESPKHTMGG